MNDDQITALASEYAEEIVQDTDSYPELPICLLNEMRKEVAEDFEEKIRFLLRRFCLAEKKEIEAKYQEAKERYFNPDDEIEKTMYGGRMSMLEYLFPEIAKEVEDNHGNQA